MADDALESASRLLARRVGLRIDPAIRGRLLRALNDEAAERGGDRGAYVRSLHDDGEALQDLLNLITVQESSFFRGPAQFDALATSILPALRSKGIPVRIWSAGCANGQEAYSLAMVLAESGIQDWQIIASDISTTALERARRGRYAERELGGLSPERRARHLVRLEESTADRVPRGDRLDWEIVPTLRSHVSVVRHNLAADDLPIRRGECAIVFCRNVLIYFARPDAVSFLERLASWMPPEGHLFLGYSESLWQVTDRFELARIGQAFAYRNCPVDRAADPPLLRATARRDASQPTPPPVSTSPPPVRPTPAGPPKPPPPQEASVGRSSSAAPRPNAHAIETPAFGDVFAEGEAALGRGDHAAAVQDFRRAVYMDPDQPLAHLNLGLALEAIGEDKAATRAYAAARAALGRCDEPEVEALLEGYHFDALVQLLDAKAAVR